MVSSYPIWAIIILGILSITVIVFNIAVCILVVVVRNLRTYTNWFVVSLAFSDILIGSALFIQYSLFVKSPVVLNIIYATSLLSSVANLSAVTFDRYLAVMRPLTYTATISKCFIKILVAVWGVGLICALLPLTWYNSSNMVFLQVYQFFVLVFGIIIPFILIFVGYLKISRQVRNCVKRERQLTRSIVDKTEYVKCKNVSSEAKLARVFIAIAVMFVLSWLPVIHVTVVMAIGKPKLMVKALNKCSPFSLALGSLVNPMLYSFMKPDFKRALRKILVQIFCDRRDFSYGRGERSGSDVLKPELVVNSKRGTSFVTSEI